MTIHFRPVEETTDLTLRVALSIAGGSGTGKTYSACLLMRGLCGGEAFAVLDTENKRALHYRADFPEMLHFNFGPEQDGASVGFPPERWIAQIDYLESKGVKGLVIDSFSHAWEGIGGVLEMQAAILDRMTGGDQAKAARMGQLAWAEVKPRYRRLIERIVQAKMHVIICIRAKPVMQAKSKETGWKEQNAHATKLRRADLPWDIASDRDLIFEMTASMLMEPERPGEPVLLKCPDHFRGLFPGQKRVSVDIGEKMAAWAEEGGVDRTSKELMDAARDHARLGKDGFTAWWKTLDKNQRGVVRPILPELQQTANRADINDDDEPFAEEPEITPTAEDIARAQREAEEAAAKQITEYARAE